MIEVAALTSGRDIPSTRFRVRQFVRPLLELGIRVREHCPLVEKYAHPAAPRFGRLWTAAKLVSRVPGVLASRRADVAWVERDLIPGRYSMESFLPRRSVLDIDDAIWLTGKPGYSERIARRCRGVIAGNAFIAEHYRDVAGDVWVVPTSVDTERWQPRPRTGTSRWTAGWIGTSGNLEFLYSIEAPLAGFLSDHRDAELLVVCDRRPEFRDLPEGSWRYQPWSAETEVDLVGSMDLGLMPLPDNEWARGKCGAKMLLYMAMGLPVLVTPVGTNAEILARGGAGLGARAPKDWREGLTALFEDPVLSARCGSAGRRLAAEAYSVGQSAARLADIFHGVADNPS